MIHRAVFAVALAVPLGIPHPARTQLPDGPGRTQVETFCLGCHDAARISNSGYSTADWNNIVAMMRNVGAPLPLDQVRTVTAYLARNFPEKPRPVPKVLSGPVQVAFHEWEAPTPGSRPHDPLATPDGAIWYTGHMANLLGRLDPKTGTIREFHPDLPNSGPHGLVADAQGNIWFTANFAGYIGKLDPRAGKFSEYKLPDPTAHDPHTLLFDRNGMLWFTVQSANMIGRLDPTTGAIKLVRVPTARANPYGMAFNSNGVLFVDLFGTNKLASIDDAATMRITEHALPHAESRPRRVAITPDDMVWYSDYSRGYLGRFDPRTGTVTEWPSPGGPSSLPYGMTALDG
ncbi:MAG TPA: hypothetical protein VLI93_17855, partial [Acetobacteraceae bacterium]|nr:hypothetical protein [Acetobacteraceae bacterium]